MAVKDENLLKGLRDCFFFSFFFFARCITKAIVLVVVGAVCVLL